MSKRSSGRSSEARWSSAAIFADSSGAMRGTERSIIFGSTTRMAAENYGFMAPVKAALDSSLAFLAKYLGPAK